MTPARGGGSQGPRGEISPQASESSRLASPSVISTLGTSGEDSYQLVNHFKRQVLKLMKSNFLVLIFLLL